MQKRKSKQLSRSLPGMSQRRQNADKPGENTSEKAFASRILTACDLLKGHHWLKKELKTRREGSALLVGSSVVAFRSKNTLC